MALPLSGCATRKASATRKQPYAACLTSSLSLIRKSAELAEVRVGKLPARHRAGLPFLRPCQLKVGLLCRQRNRLQSCLLTRWQACRPLARLSSCVGAPRARATRA